MNNWKTQTLEDICLIITDGSHSSPKSVDDGFPMASVKDLTPYGINLKTCRKISTVDFEKLVKQKCKPEVGDVLIAKDGNSALDTVCQIREKINVVLLSSVAILKPNFQLVTSSYLRYFLDSDTTRKYLKNGFITGAAIPRVVLKDFKRCKIQVPPLLTQQKIAGILSAYDDLIENNTRRIEILEEMARMLYREWFVKFRFPVDGEKGDGDRLSSSNQPELVESELGLIPKDWEVKKLGDIAQEIRRGVKPEDLPSNTPYIGLEHLPRRSISLSEWETVEQIQSTKLIFKKGEILFGKIRPYFHKVGVAPINGVCSSDAIVIQPKDDKYFSLVLSCVSSDDFVAHATQTSQGTKMPRANWKVLIEYPVLIPPESILDKFDNTIRENISRIHNLIFKNINLRKTRDLLLPRLISGEIDVEDLDLNLGAVMNIKH
jgi:type I restriction enzyme S subunit